MEDFTSNMENALMEGVKWTGKALFKGILKFVLIVGMGVLLNWAAGLYLLLGYEMGWGLRIAIILLMFILFPLFYIFNAFFFSIKSGVRYLYKKVIKEKMREWAVNQAENLLKGSEDGTTDEPQVEKEEIIQTETMESKKGSSGMLSSYMVRILRKIPFNEIAGKLKNQTGNLSNADALTEQILLRVEGQMNTIINLTLPSRIYLLFFLNLIFVMYCMYILGMFEEL